MNILVFGKDGQLGKAFQKHFFSMHLAEMHIQYAGRDQCDLSNLHQLTDFLKQSKADLIINAAAYTAVDKAETEVDLAYAINASAPECMARYAVEQGATLLHYSTDYVFDGGKEGFYIEGDPRNPLGIYGKSKAAGEEAIERAFVNASQGRYAIFRTSWVYGDGSNFIRTILRLAKEREELKVIEDQYGVPTNADWLANVSLHLVLDSQHKLREFASGIYHAVPNGETTWYGLAQLAIQAAQDAGVILKAGPGSIKPIPAVDYPLPAPRPSNSRMDATKLRLAIEQCGDMSKLKHCNRLWSDEVRVYVAQLAQAGLI